MANYGFSYASSIDESVPQFYSHIMMVMVDLISNFLVLACYNKEQPNCNNLLCIHSYKLTSSTHTITTTPRPITLTAPSVTTS